MSKMFRALAIAGALARLVCAQNAALMPVPKLQFLDANGVPLAGGYLYTCAAGTSCAPSFAGDPPLNPLATYTDSTAGTANANPIVLDGSGRAAVWLGSGNYKVVLQDSTGAAVWTQDNVSSTSLKAVTTTTGAVSNFSVPGTLTAGAVTVTGTVTAANVTASGTITGSVAYTAPGGTARTLAAKLNDITSPKDFGAVANGTTNDAAAINSALASGAGTVDGAGLTYKVNSSITVPAGVTLQNIKIVAGTAGMNVVLVNNYSKLLNVTITGTGTTSIIERGIYPAADGVYGVHIAGADISNMTVGIQAQPLISVTPRSWYVNAYIHDIVGTTGASEGYGILFSPASESEIHLRAYNIKRHALYLSAGAQKNFAWVDADTVYNYAVQLYSTGAQAATDQNTVWFKGKNLSNAPGQTTLSYGVGLIQNANRNTIYADVESTGSTDGAVMVQGDVTTGGWHPSDNVIQCTSTGNYLHAAVVNTEDAENTIITNSVIKGHGTVGAINITNTGGNTYALKAQGSVLATTIDGVDSTGYGITINASRGTVNATNLRIVNTSTAIADPNGLRFGYSKAFSKTLTFTSIAASTVSTQTITLPEAFANTNVQVSIASTSASVNGLSAYVTGWSSTSVTVAFSNGYAGGAITGTVHVRVTGD